MILGIDFSIRSTGLAVLCDDGSTDTCVIKPPTDDGSVKSIAERLLYIADKVEAWADLADVDTIVIEDLLHHAPSAYRGKIAGGFWHVAARVAALVDDPVILVSPKTRAKYATGTGGADKKAVIEQVTARYPQFAINGSDDIADAVTLVAIGARMTGRPIDLDLPEINLSALRTKPKGKR